jgi:DNA methylase
MKPVALVERAIRNSSKSRDIVLDPFGGSGSTLIACEKTGRQGRLIWTPMAGPTTTSPPSARLSRRDQTRSLNRLL